MSSSQDSTRPISVAELLARNGTIGAPPVGGRRRRRRGNSLAVSVAELTGEIPVIVDPVAVDPVAEELVAEELVADDSGVEELIVEETFVAETFVEETFVEETFVEETFAEETFVAETFVGETFVAETFAEETFAEETFAAETVEETVEETFAAETFVAEPIEELAEQFQHSETSPLADTDYTDYPDYTDHADHTDVVVESTAAVDYSDPVPEVAPPLSDVPLPRRGPGPELSHDPRVLRRPSGAEQMTYDPVDQSVDLYDLVGDPEDEAEDLRSYLQSAEGALFSGETVADDLARGGPAGSDEFVASDRTPAAQEWPREGGLTALRHGLVAVVQSVLAVVFGAGLFIGFDQLWRWNNIVALVLSVLVILSLVIAVRLVRKTEDISSTLIAVAVGALVTLGPLALLQTN
ncbi:MAG: hypothetical protein NT156_11185 [Mycobacterium sp.]|nr:hypothetical protein [Mycobacterium sp.]